VRLTVPVLHDDTIMLRPPEAGDAAAITAAVQDPDIPRFTMVPSPYTVDDAVAYLEGCAARWSSGDAAPFVITDGATGTLLGSIGLHDLGVAMTGPHVGYWVAAEARGRGVATRALRLIARWALEDLALARLEVYVFVENDRSQRVAASAGFTREGIRTFVDHPTRRRELVVFSRTAVAGLPATSTP
jgi:RimJ/RimL family protein N-acetyltransferase